MRTPVRRVLVLGRVRDLNHVSAVCPCSEDVVLTDGAEVHAEHDPPAIGVDDEQEPPTVEQDPLPVRRPAWRPTRSPRRDLPKTRSVDVHHEHRGVAALPKIVCPDERNAGPVGRVVARNVMTPAEWVRGDPEEAASVGSSTSIHAVAGGIGVVPALAGETGTIGRPDPEGDVQGGIINRQDRVARPIRVECGSSEHPKLGESEGGNLAPVRRPVGTTAVGQELPGVAPVGIGAVGASSPAQAVSRTAVGMAAPVSVRDRIVGCSRLGNRAAAEAAAPRTGTCPHRKSDITGGRPSASPLRSMSGIASSGSSGERGRTAGLSGRRLAKWRIPDPAQHINDRAPHL